MTFMQTEAACAYILDRLARELAPALTYHNLNHTLDVTAQADRIARAEGVTDAESLALLQTAATYHDAGFMHVYDEHEEESCRIATAELPRFGYAPAQIETICRLIRATRVPQTPLDALSQILCDADLDYLGRADYLPVSQTLFAEWTAYGKLPDPTRWPAIQQGFLGKHRYFTRTSQTLRQPVKQAALDAMI
jgi:uncharacterized protein